MRHKLAVLDPMRLFFFASVALVLTFCGGQSSDSGSSESHFLSPCDAGCETGFSCVCGVCTKLCDGADGCGALSGATCETASCDTPTENVCDVMCAAAGDCAALGAGYDCMEGRCRRENNGSGDAAPLTCEQRAQQASQRVQDVALAADRSCATDSDCVLAPNDSDCFASCGAILSTEGAATLASAIDELNSGLCAGFEADRCQVIIPPCAFPGDPVCIAGECTSSLSTGENLTCDEWAAEATRRVEDAIRAADQTCTTDADCTRILTATPCSPCGATFVSTESAETVQATIDSIATGFCAGFADQCPQPGGPACLPPADAVCSGGLCTPGVSCTARADEAFQRMQDAVQSADRNCTMASDCVAISNSSNCQYGCGVVLSVDGATALQATIDELNNTICAAYDSTCPPPIPPPCPFPGNTTCIDGQCVMAL